MWRGGTIWTRPNGTVNQGQDVVFCFESCGQLRGGEFESGGPVLPTECVNR